VRVCARVRVRARVRVSRLRGMEVRGELICDLGDQPLE
jgi:hypothetical protein